MCREISVFIKIWLETGYFTWRPEYIYDYLAEALEWEMFRVKFVEKIKIHILNLIIFSEKEIMWKNMVEADRPQMKI